MLPSSGFGANTPAGCRIIFGLAASTCLLFKIDHHDFVSFNLVCTPVDVIFGWQLQRLLFASVAHTSFVGLSLALLVCWRRFAWIEYQVGTFGFLLWFTVSSVILHGAYCVLMVILAPIISSSLATGEVHGLFPLITASLVVNTKDNDNSTVWLWPLPLHISARALPPVVIMASWVMHMDTHLDVIVAYFLASGGPPSLFEPSTDLLDKAEQTDIGKWLLLQLQAFDSFVCRPDSFGGSILPGGASFGDKSFGGSGSPYGRKDLGDFEALAPPTASTFSSSNRNSPSSQSSIAGGSLSASSAASLGGATSRLAVPGFAEAPHSAQPPVSSGVAARLAGAGVPTSTQSGTSTGEASHPLQPAAVISSAVQQQAVVSASAPHPLAAVGAASAVIANATASPAMVSAPTFVGSGPEDAAAPSGTSFHTMGDDDSDAEEIIDPLSKLPDPNSDDLADIYDQL